MRPERTTTGLESPRRADAVALFTAVAVGALCVCALIRTGWVPSDEGTLAQSALRVYQGQLPHRDFAEIYTGGLSFLHAGAFLLFGVNLLSLRIAAFVVFLLWLPAVYWIARQFASPFWSMMITLTAVGWSYPNYVAAMPSWYNLFFATFGAAALLRFLKSGSRRWLILAGAFGGASILIKVVGLYYVAGALLFFVFLEQTEEIAAGVVKRSRAYQLVIAGGLLAYVALLTRMVWPELGVGEAYAFLLPSIFCAGLLLWRERGRLEATSSERFAKLFGLIFPFLAGIALILVVYLLPYLATKSVGLLVHGMMASVASRMSGLAGRQHPPGLEEVAYYGLTTMGVILTGLYSEFAQRKIVVGVVAVGLGIVVIASALANQLQDTWMMAGALTPLVVLLGTTMVALNKGRRSETKLPQQKAMLLVMLAATCSLVQFPFPYVTYFLYCAPLTLLAMIACIALGGGWSKRPLLAVVLFFFLGFGFVVMVPKHLYNPDSRWGAMHGLTLPRSGGLRVDGTTPDYEKIVPFLQAHSPNGLLYAGNDCPELYFLSGLTNPTRDDTGAPASEVIAALQSGKLQVVALNDESFFASGSASPELRAAVGSFLPHTEKLGRFSIYWR